MPFSLDHAVIAVRNLDPAIQDYRRLGFTVVPGGMHANRATHNALITFANGTYLELLAATGQRPLPGLIDFSGLLHAGEGLVGFALRSSDLEADAVRLRAQGFVPGEIIPGERRRADGARVQWKLALLAEDFVPFLIQDMTPQEWRISRDPAVMTHANGALGLCSIRIAVRDLPGAAERYARLFGLPPQPSVGSALTVGAINLRAAPTSERAEQMAGLDLLLAQGDADEFPSTLTHGVNFFATHAG